MWIHRQIQYTSTRSQTDPIYLYKVTNRSNIPLQGHKQIQYTSTRSQTDPIYLYKVTNRSNIPLQGHKQIQYTSTRSQTDPIYLYKVTNRSNIPLQGHKQIQYTSTRSQTELYVNLSHKYYCIQIAPIIPEQNRPFVHHMLVFICPRDSTIETDGICDEIANSFFGCFGGQIISAWAVGGEVSRGQCKPCVS